MHHQNTNPKKLVKVSVQVSPCVRNAFVRIISMIEYGGERQIAAGQDVLAAQEHELEEKCPYP